MADLTRVLSDFAAGLAFEDLPAEVVDCTKMFIADYIAACYAGYAINWDFNRAVFEMTDRTGGTGDASVFFSDRKFPAANAAFMNAIYAHGADMDDGNRKAMGHVGAHVMSAVFALAEELKIKDLRRIFTAINVGYEVYNRTAAAVQPGLVRRGFHSTGTAGALGAAAAAAKLMDLDSDGIYNAIALAAVQASGLLIITESGQATKPLNPANAARTGIMSAYLASKGVKGPVDPLQSPKGWFAAMSDKYDENAVTGGLGKIFTICESYLKPYPSCRHTHCTIEAASYIRKKMNGLGFTTEDIDSVEVGIYENAIRIAGQIVYPASVEDTKFSIQYTLACALCTGDFTLEELDPAAAPEEVKAVSGKIRLISDPEMENTAAGIRGARVCVLLKNGEKFEETVLLPKGDARNPFTWDDLTRKMKACIECARKAEGKTPGADDEAAVAIESIRGLDFDTDFQGLGI